MLYLQKIFSVEIILGRQLIKNFFFALSFHSKEKRNSETQKHGSKKESS